MSGKAIRILLVDDDPMFCEGIRDFLEHILDASIVGMVNDGTSVLQQVKALQPDLILMDIRMPHMNGLEVLEQLNREGIETKVIILSNSTEQREAAVAGGASAFLGKLTIFEKLESTIQSVLELPE